MSMSHVFLEACVNRVNGFSVNPHANRSSLSEYMECYDTGRASGFSSGETTWR